MEKDKNSVTSSPLVTVAVVSFCQRHLLNDCLQSVFSQDYDNIELIICDDASCDFDCDEVMQYIQEHKSENIRNIVIYKHESNVGTVKNCQKAFELSQGQYLKFQAGDDMLAEDDVLSKMVHVFEKERVNLIFSRARGCLHDGTLTANLYPSDDAFDMASRCNAEELFELIGTRCWGEFVNAPAAFWRKSFLEQMGGFDLSFKYTEDWPMWLKVCASGECPKYVDVVTVLYRYGGISNSQNEQNIFLGKEHYMESARMLREKALPRMRERHSLWACLKCLQATKSIEERVTQEIYWASWGFSSKLFWKLKNVPFSFLSFLIKCNRGVFTIKVGKCLIWTVLFGILYQFDIEISHLFLLKPVWAGLFIFWIMVSLCLCLLRAFAESFQLVSVLKRGIQR